MGDYLGFTPDTTPEQARATFAARYGEQPAEVLTTGGAILAGPVVTPTAAAGQSAPVRAESAAQWGLFALGSAW